MNEENIIKYLERHLKWINDEEGGEKADLREAYLREADLREADLREANLIGANLREANLIGANLSEADLSEADLREADLSEADLREADLSEADLREANLIGANLREANLREANLRGADLREADLRGADLRGANLNIFYGGEWIAFIDPRYIRIGCKFFTSEEWAGFSDEIISEMDSGALGYWKENKEIIMSISKKLQEKFPNKVNEKSS